MIISLANWFVIKLGNYCCKAKSVVRLLIFQFYPSCKKIIGRFCGGLSATFIYFFQATGADAEFASAQSSFSSVKSSDIATERAFKCHFSRT
jgi:hypothetical protein